MSACEECWADAQRDVMFLGGSVVDHYRTRIRNEPAHDYHKPEQGDKRMTVALNIQGPDGTPIATFHLYDDVFEVMVTEAAINGVNVAEHIAQVIVGHAEDITNSIEEDA